MTGQTTELEQEARYLHSIFFRKPLPDTVVARYVAANRLCFPELSIADAAMIRKIVSRAMDAEAVELVLRWRKSGSVLTRKIQILFYLVEVRAEYYSDFVNQKPGWGRAILKLTAAAVWSLWKFAKGTLLVRRHGFV